MPSDPIKGVFLLCFDASSLVWEPSVFWQIVVKTWISRIIHAPLPVRKIPWFYEDGDYAQKYFLGKNSKCIFFPNFIHKNIVLLFWIFFPQNPIFHELKFFFHFFFSCFFGGIFFPSENKNKINSKKIFKVVKNRFWGKISLKKKQNIFAETNLEFFKEKIF